MKIEWIHVLITIKNGRLKGSMDRLHTSGLFLLSKQLQDYNLISLFNSFALLWLTALFWNHIIPRHSMKSNLQTHFCLTGIVWTIFYFYRKSQIANFLEGRKKRNDQQTRTCRITYLLASFPPSYYFARGVGIKTELIDKHWASSLSSCFLLCLGLILTGCINILRVCTKIIKWK